MNKGLKLLGIFSIVVVLVCLGGTAASGTDRVVAKVRVLGNEKIESSAILDQVETKEGDLLSTSTLREDIRRIYKMGYFTDVQVDVKETTAGSVVTFVVLEKPSIGRVLISGNEKIETDKIREKIDIPLHSIVKTDKIQQIIEAINKLYLSKGYYGAQVSYNIQPLQKNEVSLEIKIKEGKKAWIRKIVFKGNEHISSRKLRRKMHTKKRGLLSLIKGGGYLDEDILNNDVEILKGFYYDEGYLQVKVEKPQVIVGRKGKAITVQITIHEGSQFKTGTIDFEGDILTTKEDLFKLLKTKTGTVYRNVQVQQDMLKLTDLYADQGYANVEIRPLVRLDQETNTVNLTFKIDKGKKVYFERITIVGNDKTRDKVIRRELRFGEGDLYTSTGMKRSRQRLKMTGYFKDVEFATSKGSRDDKLDLQIKVEEAPTGSVSAGVGYSIKDQFVIQGSIAERNLFGLGYKFILDGSIGGQTGRFRVGFTDPWFLGYPVLAGVDVYSSEDTFLTSYSTKIRSVRFRLGKDLGEYLRGRVTYTFENVDVFDVAEDAPRFIKEQEGVRDSSILGFTLSMDKRDDFYFPTKGGIYRLEMANSGGFLGGNTNFYRTVGEFQQYYPLLWKFIAHGRILLGLINGYGGDDVPIWERFFVGGIRTIRGFDYGEAGPKDESGEVIGSTREIATNLELLFPLSKEMGLRGVVFFDVGKGFDSIDGDFPLLPLRTSAGFGIRWLTPMGPMTVDYGINLSPEPGERRTKVHFFLGGTF
ncbi:MAG: outer membrane protein assembly factor BamA [Deltaproteobacteria bacterium]|nr:outer membrane protein assembly factor BamA [Deltaproteobacteria bacterium]